MTVAIRTVAVAALLLYGLCSCSIDDRALTLAHHTQQPATPIAAAVSEALSARGINVTIEEQLSDPGEIFAALQERRIDLAIVEEPDRPLPGLNTVAPLYPSVLHLLHRRTEPPTSFADLVRGAGVYAGPADGAAQRLLLQVVADFGVAADEYVLLDNPWSPEPDVFFIMGGLLERDSISADYRLFSFADPDSMPGASAADAIALRHHHVRPFLLPRGTYPDLADTAVLTLSVRSLLVASEELDEELVYDIATTLLTQAQDIALVDPLVTRELTEAGFGYELMLPLHAGSRRYLNRDAPGFLERYVEVIALSFTILVSLLSGIVALHRHRQQVRKDRVDVYFGKLLDIRERISHASDDASLQSCYEDVISVQRKVLALLIDERIAADASLVAFVGLSNQMIAELGQRRAGPGSGA